jgi:hypothetical protein
METCLLLFYKYFHSLNIKYFLFYLKSKTKLIFLLEKIRFFCSFEFRCLINNVSCIFRYWLKKNKVKLINHFEYIVLSIIKSISTNNERWKEILNRRMLIISRKTTCIQKDIYSFQFIPIQDLNEWSWIELEKSL